MPDLRELHKKYPKWAHRRHRRRKRRKKSRKRRRAAGTSTEGMLMSLLHQLLLGGTFAKKHGENVLTGYTDKVKADALAPVRSRIEHRLRMERADRRDAVRGGAIGAAALAAPGPAVNPRYHFHNN